MEGLTKIDAIYIALVFIVPGYVFLSLRNQFIAGHSKVGKDQILSYVTLSGVNFAAFGWIIYAAYKNDFGVPTMALSWMLVIILIPATGGVLAGAINRRELMRGLYHWLKLEPVHTIPSAWDYKFSRSPGEWVLVKLKNGTEFAGWWGSQSFAADGYIDRDLLIERVFEVPDSGPWTSTAKSMLIMAGEISTIEFTPNVRSEEHVEERSNAATTEAAGKGAPISASK
jgi:hypothetical protein